MSRSLWARSVPLLCIALLTWTSNVKSQAPLIPPSPPLPTSTPSRREESGPDVIDSSVGYIDSALLANQFRLRFDAAYDNTRPTRAEFFYPKGGATGPGLPSPETKVDYQELSSYLELVLLQRLSAFIEAPVRFINPEINANHYGFSDLNAGLKYAILQNQETVATFQFRTYAPTGDAHEGLGTNHVSLEPALLLFHRFGECWTFEGELRDWIPIGGTDFEGNVIRYGVGLSYGERHCDRWWLTPVVEFVGWEVLGGKELAAVTPTTFVVEDAAGDSILNVKAGLRFGFGDRADFYAGYGRALTGDTWYRDIWRLEFRLFF